MEHLKGGLHLKKTFIATTVALSLGAGFAGGSFIQQGMASEKSPQNHAMQVSVNYNQKATNHLVQLSSKNVTRIQANNQIEAAVRTSQTVWPATHDENRPGAIILTMENSWQAAIAASNLIHHPNDGPLLFVKKNGIPKETMNEIRRLNPKGNKMGTQIIVVGQVNKKVLNELKGYKTEEVQGTTPAELGKNVDEKYTALSGKQPNSVIIVSADDEDQLYSLPALSWVAHMPEPPLFVSSDSIPKETQEALQKRNGAANLYVLGNQSAVSEQVLNQLQKFGKVTRISGENPTANAIAFAKFKDEQTGFGWGITEPGHGMTLVSTSTPELATAAGPFAHKGKHGPMIFLEDGKVTQDTDSFFNMLKPTYTTDPTQGPYNHAFLFGNLKAVPYSTQGIIDERLEIVKAGEKEM